MATTYDRKPSLHDARARVRRAAEHIARLEDELAVVAELAQNGFIFRRSNMAVPRADGISGAFEDITHTDSIPAGEPFGQAPQIVSILVGETIYNLRAALDYLIYELSILDSGQAIERTQFPIESGEDSWKSRLGDNLRGLNPDHQAAIKGLQPFNGTAWTATLRDLSNPDKHRLLSIVEARTTTSIIVSNRRISDSGSLSETVRAVPADRSVHPARDAPIKTLFGDGAPVLETLRNLQQQVAGVVASFDSDFR